ncbi:hypothetical protein GCM10022244_03440 [Streptomyces gulbargensis]|uniref:Uncharacterized protein n=1 Tax=Streptomyces gulbargensis TaxID=364901 RepID=A0ABP7L810_9ACTN
MGALVIGAGRRPRITEAAAVPPGTGREEPAAEMTGAGRLPSEAPFRPGGSRFGGGGRR